MTASLEDIATLVALQLGQRKVRAGDHLVEDLGAESADLVNLAANIEEKYHIDLDEAALARVRTVADLHALVASRLRAA